MCQYERLAFRTLLGYAMQNLFTCVQIVFPKVGMPHKNLFTCVKIDSSLVHAVLCQMIRGSVKFCVTASWFVLQIILKFRLGFHFFIQHEWRNVK